MIGSAVRLCLFVAGTSIAMSEDSAIELQLSCPEEVGKRTSTQLRRTLKQRPERPKEETEMSKQILKTLTMLTLVVGFALAAGVVSANGQMTSTFVTADIPFDFVVADKTLPGGKYIVSSLTQGGDALKVSSRDGQSAAMRLTNLIPEKREKRTARMVFHRYGQKYFLAEVWSGNDYGHQLRRCKTERILQHELASNTSKSDSATGSYQVVEVVALVH
jgi:hypothetical protein